VLDQRSTNGDHSGNFMNAARAWLVNKLSEYNTALESGDIIMSGALARMLPAKTGDQFLLEFTGVPALRVRFSS
jgi:2-keto-4-pentenoate hydratase